LPAAHLTSHKIHQVAGDIATQPNKNQQR